MEPNDRRFTGRERFSIRTFDRSIHGRVEEDTYGNNITRDMRFIDSRLRGRPVVYESHTQSPHSPSRERMPSIEPIREEFTIVGDIQRRFHPLVIPALESPSRIFPMEEPLLPPFRGIEKAPPRWEYRDKRPLCQERDDRFCDEEPIVEWRLPVLPPKQALRYWFTIENAQPRVEFVHYYEVDRPYFASERKVSDHPDNFSTNRRPRIQRSRSVEDIPNTILDDQISTLLNGLQTLGKDMQRFTIATWADESATENSVVKDINIIKDIYCENTRMEQTSVENMNLENIEHASVGTKDPATDEAISVEASAQDDEQVIQPIETTTDREPVNANAEEHEKITPYAYTRERANSIHNITESSRFDKQPLVQAVSAPEEPSEEFTAFRKRLNTAPSGTVLRKTTVQTQTIVTRVIRRRRSTFGAKDLSRGDPIILKVPAETPVKKVSLIPADFERPMQPETYRARLASFLRRNPHTDQEDFPLFLVHKVFAGAKSGN